eukprot:CAMPEP_0171833538 /NCGR_PEP_ID=MMETSP0992-20121227/9940_1 /TAXON_ID=483369 /ORGANISM="non described non described, Strain CCMP2098" /LENGTH=338 /DNA_ID=CAMNT_0012449175 /DNA_START=125 /DNA_END=1139 /DNA_ORIENTATION=+
MSAEEGSKFWDEEKEKDLVTDPRFEAAIELRKQGQYDDSIEFFSEMLKTFEGEEPPVFTAALYFQYGSTLVCSIEADEGSQDHNSEQDQKEGTAGKEIENNADKGIAADDTTGKRTIEAEIADNGESSSKKARTAAATGESSSSSSSSADCCNGGGNSGGSVVVDDAAEEQSNDDDGSESEGSTEGSTETVAWQCLDTAATSTNFGDLNMATGCFADALVEYEQVLKFRETAQQQKKQGAPSSVADVCQLVDTNMQVAFAYLEHINANGEVNVEVQTTEGENVVVTAAVDCKTQMLAYREQAKKAMETLITRLANEQIKCTREDQDAMCVQIQLHSAW